MNAYVTLLERCGHRVVPQVRIYAVINLNDKEAGVKRLNGDELKAYAIEVGAKEAADWLNKQLKNTKWKEALHEQIGGCWMCETIGGGIAGPLLDNIELIQEATKAGWEKGEGL